MSSPLRKPLLIYFYLSIFLIGNISAQEEAPSLPLHATPSVLEDSTLKYEVQTFDYLKAKDAIILPAEEGVQIQVIGLEPGVVKKTYLLLEDETIPSIEVSKLIDFNGLTVAVFPPQLVKAESPGQFYLDPELGQRLGIAIRSDGEVKWIEVTLSTDPTDPTDPPPSGNLTPEDLDGITNQVKGAVLTLQDPVTAAYIKKYLTNTSLSEVLDVATEQVQKAVQDALTESMKELKPPYKDWYNLFRVPLNQKIISLEVSGKVKSTGDLQQIVDAVIKGFDEGQTSANVPYITFYSRENCVLCEEWRRIVKPDLERLGWAIKEETLAPTESAPRFLVCEKGRCSQLVNGYMSRDKLAQVLTKLRQ